MYVLSSFVNCISIYTLPLIKGNKNATDSFNETKDNIRHGHSITDINIHFNIDKSKTNIHFYNLPYPDSLHITRQTNLLPQPLPPITDALKNNGKTKLYTKLKRENKHTNSFNTLSPRLITHNKTNKIPSLKNSITYSLRNNDKTKTSTNLKR